MHNRASPQAYFVKYVYQFIPSGSVELPETIVEPGGEPWLMAAYDGVPARRAWPM